MPWMLTQPQGGRQSQPSPPLLADKAGQGAVIVPLSSGLQNERLQNRVEQSGPPWVSPGCHSPELAGVLLASPQPDSSHFSSCLHFFSNFFQFIQEKF